MFQNSIFRALSPALSNVPNAKYLAHLAHQSQNPSLISSSKSQKIWDMAIVSSQIWDGTDINAKHCLAYLIRFFFSPPIRCISCSLSIYISRFICLAFSPRPLANPILPSSISPSPILPRWETETTQARHWSLTHFATKRNSSVKEWWPEVKTSINNDDGGGLGCGFVWFGGWDAVCWIL